MKHLLIISFSILLTAVVCGSLDAQHLQPVHPSLADMDYDRLCYVDTVINRSIADKEIPGAVLAVVRGKQMVWLKAYGNKQVYPDTLPMETNTVFDLASVSKPLSTAISAMILLERGQLRLKDNVSFYLSGFQPWVDSTGRKKQIRIVELLTHTSGLPPYADVKELQEKYAAPDPEGLLEHISTVRRDTEPGTAHAYSCLNFITLQHIIEKVTGMSLQDFAKMNIFAPLGMSHTDYKPTGELLKLVAPTSKQRDGTVLRGTVHDPLANIMNGGVSGNAGLFSNAEDLAVLAAMLINDGEVNSVRILAPLTIRTMRSVPPGFEEFGRSLGWDVYSWGGREGELFGISAYGHTGYTGTSFTVDPETGTAVILLAHRVHPVDKGSVSRLRDLVKNVVAASIIEP